MYVCMYVCMYILGGADLEEGDDASEEVVEVLVHVDPATSSALAVLVLLLPVRNPYYSTPREESFTILLPERNPLLFYSRRGILYYPRRPGAPRTAPRPARGLRTSPGRGSNNNNDNRSSSSSSKSNSNSHSNHNSNGNSNSDN